MRIIILIFGILFWAKEFAQNNFYSNYDFSSRTDFGLKIKEVSTTNKYVIFGRVTSGARGGKFLMLDSIGAQKQHKNHTNGINALFLGVISVYNTFLGYGSFYNSTEGAADSYLLK
jgi:hypothetical protein